MKHLILFTILFAFQIKVFSQTVQGTIKKTDPYEMTVYAKSSGADATNTDYYSFLVAVSLDSSAIAPAPPPAIVGVCPLPSSAISTLAVHPINGRYVYIFSITGSGNITFLENTENPILVVTFPIDPTIGSEHIQLNDYTGEGGGGGGGPTFSALWYAQFQANDYTNYDEKFYAGAGQTAVNTPSKNSHVASGAPLPVQLISFTAAKEGIHDAQLEWSTATEKNVSHFVLERSLNDTRSWDEISIEDAIGESDFTQNYSYFDRNIPLNKSENPSVFYRLKTFDFDGSFEYSKIRSLNFDRKNIDITTYPNPTTTYINIGWSNNTLEEYEIADMEIYDISGRLMLKKEISSDRMHQENIAYFPSGTYHILVSSGGETYSDKFVKQ